VEEIDGSAFAGCPFLVQVSGENRKFVVEGPFLLTADGTELVRYFGRERDVVVPMKVESLGTSCFESCNDIESVAFESGSKLRRIRRSALSGCELLTGIAIPASVEVIEESAFKKCDGLEECLMVEDGNLVGIGNEAFADCRSLRSFYIPRSVEGIGHNCFRGCVFLRVSAI
jgi:hypothetical protein